MAVQYALLAAGTIIQGMGQMRANRAQAGSERANAEFYREQARFAREAGDRARMIFDRESDVLFGEQKSALAKAGIDSLSSSKFMAEQILFREQESYAIKKEADLNVRLASLRAEASDRAADQLGDPFTNFLGFAGPAVQGLSTLYND